MSIRASKKNAIGVGLIGFGNIGTGVVRYLHENADLIEARLGIPLRLKWICDVDLKTKRDAPYSKSQLVSDYAKVLSDPDVSIVIELIGGTTVAKSVVESALKARKAVVTANKALLAEHGASIIALARRMNTPLLYESAVMAGVPVLRSLLQSLCGNRFRRLAGVVNGTCNYILTRMEEEGAPFDQILTSAQKLGYAEANAELDVGGVDAAHKCAILASLAFGQDIRAGDIHCDGIRFIDPLDFEIAADYQMKIKLLAVAEQLESSRVLARVHPALIARTSPLAQISGVQNGLLIEGEPMGPYFFSGQGAGPRSTASGVIGDVMAIAASLSAGVKPDFQLLPVPSGRKRTASILDWAGRYYLRVKADDLRGGLSALAAAFERNGVPVSDIAETTVEQGSEKTAWVTLITGTTTERTFHKVQRVLKQRRIATTWSMIRIQDGV